MEKHWKVTAYYSLTKISIVVEADSEEQAEDIALHIFVEEWGRLARYYENMETVESEPEIRYWKYTAAYSDTTISTIVEAPNQAQARAMATERLRDRHVEGWDWEYLALEGSW